MTQPWSMFALHPRDQRRHGARGLDLSHFGSRHSVTRSAEGLRRLGTGLCGYSFLRAYRHIRDGTREQADE